MQNSVLNFKNQFKTELDDIHNNSLAQPHLPLLLYFPPTRELSKPSVNALGNKPRIFDAYQNALSASSGSLENFTEWFIWQENLAISSKKENTLFEKTCQAVYTLLSDDQHKYEGLFTNWERSRKGEVMIHKNEMPLPLSYLSSGELALLRMVTGIVWRLHTLNPGLENPLSGNGILLIDEIDLHLHPRWQQKVVTKLTELFPNLQILLTTHSPFILQRFGSEDGRVFRIENFKIQPEKSVKYWTLQDVVEEIQHTESEATLRQKLLQKAFDLLDEEQLEALKAEFAALEQQLPPNDKDLLFLKNEINFLEDSET
jgi:predicted ATP-binding protein involved in virulence